MESIAVPCSAVQCNAVECSAVQCSAVQCSVMQRSAVQCSEMQCSALQVHLGTKTFSNSTAQGVDPLLNVFRDGQIYSAPTAIFLHNISKKIQ